MGFHKAAKAEAPKAKRSGKVKTEVNVEDLRLYAALNAASKAIATIIDTLKQDVNAVALEAFIEQGNAESINGVDGDTNASLQLRKRTGRSMLTESEQALLESVGISTEVSAASRVYINPQYADNDEMANKVMEALEGVVPDDFLLSTGEKYVTTSNSINEAFAARKSGKINDAMLREILQVVGTQAARTKFGGSHAEMMEILSEIIAEG